MTNQTDRAGRQARFLFKIGYRHFRKMMNSGRDRASWLYGYMNPYLASERVMRNAIADAWANSQVRS